MNIPSNSFKFRNAKREEIYKILINIDPNKAYGIDEIPRRFLTHGAELLTEPLCEIISLSLSSKFPLMRNTAKVKPLYKKGKNTEPENYRPVSLLPILSKIIERIEHLAKHDILYEYQSGFRSKHSVNTIFFNWDSLHARLNSHYKHGVTRKRSTKRLKHTGNLFRKNIQFIRCLLILDLKLFRL